MGVVGVLDAVGAVGAIGVGGAEVGTVGAVGASVDAYGVDIYRSLEAPMAPTDGTAG